MRKTVSMIAALLLTASIAMAGAVSAHGEEADAIQEETAAVAVAEEAAAVVLDEGTTPITTTVIETTVSEETTVQTETSATVQTTAETTTQTMTSATAAPAPTIGVKDVAGKWKFQIAADGRNVETSPKDSGTLEIRSDGTYTFTDQDGKTTNGVVSFQLDGIGDTTFTVVIFKEIDMTATYRGDVMPVGNGGIWRFIRDDGTTPAPAATTAATTKAAAATTKTAATTAKAATTTAKAATTTKATTTTKAGNTKSSDSPKTGDAFPALLLAGMAAAGAAAAFTMKKH